MIVTIFPILLLIVAFVVVGILVGARVTAQHREIGLLKAAGFTPRQVGIVLSKIAFTPGVSGVVIA